MLKLSKTRDKLGKNKQLNAKFGKAIAKIDQNSSQMLKKQARC